MTNRRVYGHDMAGGTIIVRASHIAANEHVRNVSTKHQHALVHILMKDYISLRDVWTGHMFSYQ